VLLARLGIGAAGMHAIGVLEVAGAIALVIPRLCGLAALAFVALMSGATGLASRTSANSVRVCGSLFSLGTAAIT